MSKPEEMTLETAKELTAMAKEGTCAFTVPALIANCNWLIERVEELERQLQSARELAENVKRTQEIMERFEFTQPPDGKAWQNIVSMAREFLKLLEGK